MASSILVCVALLLIANRPGGAARASHPSSFVHIPVRWNGHVAGSCRSRVYEYAHTGKNGFDGRSSGLGDFKHRGVDWIWYPGIPGGVRTRRDVTRLQISASLTGRRGLKRPPGEGGTQNPELQAAPVEVIEDIDKYFAILAANREKIVVIKVYATFCRACKAFDRKYRQLAIDYEKKGANVKFCDMNWMANRDLCKSLQVKKLPHIELYAGHRGRLESFVCGPSRVGVLGEKLELLLADPSDPSVGASVPGPLDSDAIMDFGASGNEDHGEL